MFGANVSDNCFIGKQKHCQTKPISVEFMSSKFRCYLIEHSPYFETSGRSASTTATKIFQISNSKQRLLKEMR